MRRLIGLVLPTLLALALLAAPAAAQPADVDADEAGPIVLAAEAGDEGPGGPDPASHDAEDNLARELGGYGEMETRFTWGAAFLMLFLGAVGAALMGGLYWLLVHRPRQREGS